MGALSRADGSALFSMGSTRVLATVNGPRECMQRGGALQSSAIVSVLFHAASFSSVSGDRRKSKRSLNVSSAAGRPDRRMTEWASLVEDVFSTAIPLDLFPRSQIVISIEVLDADGSVLAAAINATTLALVDAGIPITDYVLATTVAHAERACLIDTNRSEEPMLASHVGSMPRMTMACFGRDARGQNLLLHLDSAPSVSVDRVNAMMDAGATAIADLFAIVDQSIVRPGLENRALSRVL